MARPAATRRGRRPAFHLRLSQRTRTVIEVTIFVTAVFFLGWGADALARLGA